MTTPEEHAPSRRTFLGATGAAGSAAAVTAVFGVPPRTGTGSATLARERAMIVRVARVGTVFPVRFPASGQAIPSTASRAIARLSAAQRKLPRGAARLAEGTAPTAGRLRAAERTMPADQLALARAGADEMIAAGLLGAGQASLLAGIARLAATSTPVGSQELTATVALAVGTVFTGTKASAAGVVAGQWLGTLRIMDQQGTLHQVLQQRGIR